MKNLEISKIFREIADILEIQGQSIFRIRAYQRAAQNLEGLTRDIEDYVKEDRLSEIPGIGKDLSGKIREYVSTGKIKAYEALKRAIPAGLLELLKIPSVGPKTAKLLSEQLKIKNLQKLRTAAIIWRMSGPFWPGSGPVSP